MNVVVLGSNGQLASHLKQLLPQARFLGRLDVDLADARALEQALLSAQPSHIVNAAAYTMVDRAEDEPALAWAVNAAAPAVMARIANTLGIPLVHVSTDYVFDGRKPSAWCVDDPVNPLNTYGRTKLAGELAVRSLCHRYWILRTSWIFSEFGSNFVKTMLRLAREKRQLRVVDDQRGRPTYAADLAELIRCLISEDVPDDARRYGVHHACGGRAVSWREFAQVIVDQAFESGLLQQRVDVVPIRTAEFPTRAQRPSNSVLQPTSPLADREREISFDWEVGLSRVLAHLQKAEG